ncbi:MAG: hypothetical protein V4622_09465 [Bacteroidota bacterium]
MLKKTLLKGYTIICFFLVVLLLNSCTIEKRLHQKGFHVEWRKLSTNSSSSVKSEELKVGKIEDFDLATRDSINISSKEYDVFSSASEKIKENIITNKIISENKTIRIENVSQSIKKDEKSKNETEKQAESKKLNIETLLSLIFTILGFISFGILINALKYYFFANALIISFVIFFLFSILALIFSIRALKKISKNKNKGLLFASISLIYGIGATLLALLISLMVIGLAYS